MTKNHYSILIAGILSASIAMSANAGTEWEIKVFDTHMSFFDINNSGQLLGYDSAIKRYLITGPDGEGISNITEFSNNLNVNAFNDSGQIAGSFLKDGSSHVFITGPNGTNMVDLGTLGKHGSASDINNSGQIIGQFTTPENNTHAFITGPNGIGMTDLGTFGGKNSYASAINESGQVVGWSQTADGIPHAFITGPNGIGMTDLGTLPYDNASQATDINDDAQVVGFSGSYTPTPDWGYVSTGAFITGPNGENMIPLGASYTDYPKINNSGQAIFDIEAGISLLYSDGVLTILTGLPIIREAGLIEINALGINDKGQILGFGYLKCCNPTSFLLTPISPVPEPSVYAMLLTGLGLLGLMAFRRNRLFKLTDY
ncbi:PEP-CTERM sorting domain-containing protein [Nitrosomonas sp. sh817]|uniref:PEP-CTERM sorting domain-containing protein n=1 Tax=Nitrosomonas sp. sh817 TaxID=3070658 RepID=UPI0027DC0C70|nr:PEP-CTERM sorting domain-containing protein [Nitrosomonas sp. sh817]WMJ08512.1 PEP-CTERM sorting domain-containing protein [Nitrosomonas sp. sh817]